MTDETERTGRVIDWAAARERLAELERLADRGWERSPDETARILADRARHYAARPVGAESESRRQGERLFVFERSGLRLAVDPGAVAGVVPFESATPVPCTPPHVRGVVHLKGAVVTVLDLAALLGIEVTGEPARLVAVSDDSAVIGLLADGTLGAQVVSRPARPVRRAGQPSWIATSADGVAIVDLPALLGDRRVVVSEEISTLERSQDS